jgi:RHS repeat-associated protein
MKLFRLSYKYGILPFLLMALPGADCAQTPQTPPPAYTSSAVSYIRTWDALSPQTDPNTMTGGTVQDVRQSTQYFDGLGRLVQTVVKQGSLKNSTSSNVDLVTPVVYDNMGREQYRYLPFASNAATAGDVVNDGNFKTDPFQQQVAFYNSYLSGQTGEITGGLNWSYGKFNYETSPLQRIITAFPPGQGWVGSESGPTPHCVRHQYISNTGSTGDNIQVWNCSAAAGAIPASGGAYAAGQLKKTITIDENGLQTVEFFDLEDKMILKQVQQAATTGNNHAGWLNTYYIYDNLNNLRYVLQPQAVQLLLNSATWNLSAIPNLLTGLAFYYEYDLRNRMIIKRVPGADPVYMVYDSRDRQVMMQDGAMRVLKNWLVSVYDNYNRITKTGIFYDPIDAFSTHLSNANAAAIQPDGSSYPATTTNFTLEKQNFYDDYAWMSSTPLSAGYYAGGETSGNFSTSYGSFPYPRPVTRTSYSTLGLSTGTIAAVVGSLGEYVQTTVYVSNFYDDHDRLIQSQESNISGGIDKIFHQYSFDGKELATNFSPSKSASNHQDYTILTNKTYDALGRLTNIAKQVTNPGSTPQKPVSTLYYDELGLLKKKTLGNNQDQQNFEYNVRGWLLGVNRGYVNATPAGGPSVTNYFGFELAYDKTGSSAPGNTYATPQFNGNVGGMTWKSAGDGIARKYDYTYDYANRLTAANFNQNSSGTAWDHTTMDFSVSISQYDANGNIQRMDQKGWSGISSGLIDQLTYNYFPTSNRLQNVQDALSNSNTTLGDFHYSTAYQATLGGAKPVTATDYSYDTNGNLTADKNKDITGIINNYLNLPFMITTSKGTIKYAYDAMGRKLQKITNEPSATVVYNGTSYTTSIYTVNCYLNGMVYQSVTYGNSALTVLNYFDKLSFIEHEEGRIRALHNNPDHNFWITGWVYDYFEKDHLGNTRMILTEEAETNIYPPASLEGTTTDANTASGFEKQFYAIDPGYIVPQSQATGIPAYINNNGIGSNLYPTGNSGNTNTASNSQQLYRINGNANKMGLGMTLKVMAGDKIDIFGKSYYFSNNTGDNSSYNIPVLSLLSGFLGSPGAATATLGHPGATAAQLNAISSINTNVSGYLSNSVNSVPRTATTTTKPRAYVNYILFDNQFNYAGGGFSPVGNTGTITDFANASNLHNIVIPKSGYIYVYCSNESPVDVFFDNIQVTHTRGPVLEENHYYPFGLSMAGISDKALKTNYAENRYRYNGGNELQSREFSDGSGLDMYDAVHRMYDPQLGRFGQLDEMSDVSGSMTPYGFASDNPITRNDPLGLQDLAPVYVIAKHTTKNLVNTYWYYVNNHIPFDNFKDKGVRDWLYRYDRVQTWLHQYHKDLAETEMTMLEYASYFIPIGEFVNVGRLGAAAVRLLGIKRGAAIARVFWSGGKMAQLAAANYAKIMGMETLEMTLKGKLLTALSKVTTKEFMAPLWDRASAAFAKGVEETAHFVTTAEGPRVLSTWIRVELPILEQKGAQLVTHIINP